MPHHGRSLEPARSLENIARHPQSSSVNTAGQFNNQFKRYYSLRIVRKLSRLLSSSRVSDPCYAVQYQDPYLAQAQYPDPYLAQGQYPDPYLAQGQYQDIHNQPVDVHLPKSCNSDDGPRRVLSRRHILTSLREEEEESFRSMNQQLHTSQRSQYNIQDHNIRETRSLERFIPQVNVICNNEKNSYGERSHYYIPRSKPRTIFTRNGSCDLEGGNSEATPPFSRFSLSLNRGTNRLDPLLGDPCLRWADQQDPHQQDEQQDQHRRRTKSISCSPDWSSYSSSCGGSGESEGLLSERSESNLSSLSVCSSSGGGKRFSRCLLLQSISKEEMRDPHDSEYSSNGFEEQEPMSPDRPLTPGSPMSPGSPCSRQSSDDISSSTSTEDEESTSDEEVDNKINKSVTATNTSDVNDNDTKVVTKNCDNKLVKSSYTNQTNDNQQEKEDGCQDAGEVAHLQLSQLHWVGTLGIGGFGRVELVTAGVNNNKTFALKKMKKIEIQEDKHQQHILNEKNIMMSCSSPFIVQLYRTFRDSRYLYMLMEPCLGGELWTILRDKKKFDDSAAKFYTACVIKGFQYLHSKGIVYRDLKPENLLLDSSGYVKLTDFGFSKQLKDGEKSWTFCGTPEYVAPEMITNKTGHDQRADIWSVGILMYELLNGIPPFAKVRNEGDKPKNNVYSEILKGMKGVYFPPHMTSASVELIRQLCRLNPAQRPSLAITRKYMWFASMDWQALEERRLSPPFLPKITGAQDTSNFDNYTKELEQPKEDFSDWDIEF